MALKDFKSTDVSRLAADALPRVAVPINQASALPGDFYTSPELFRAERASMFDSGWLFVGRTDQVAERSSYRAVNTAAGPILLVRDADGTLRAFANICRHRGSILLDGSGKCRRIVCPYHGWSYHPDGRLSGAPDMEDVVGFNAADHGLVPVRMEEWAGFLFINPDTTAPPLLVSLGDLPDRMASHRPEELRHTWTVEMDCACNWKLILENAVETYHTGLVHRKTVGAQTSRDVDASGDWLAIQVLSERSIATLPDQLPPLPPIDGLDADAQQGTYFTLLFPACQLVFAQDCLWWLNVIPVASDRSILEIGGCFPKSTVERPDFQEKALPYYARWEAVGQEDVGILERQQVALSTRFYKPGRLSHRDAQIRKFNEWVLRRLVG